MAGEENPTAEQEMPGHGVQESHTGPAGNMGGDSAPSRTRWAGGHFARFQAASVASACSFLLPGWSLSPDPRSPAHWGDSGQELCKGDRASSPDALGVRPGRGPRGQRGRPESRDRMQDEATAGQGQRGGAASRADAEGRLRGLEGGQVPWH